MYRIVPTAGMNKLYLGSGLTRVQDSSLDLPLEQIGDFYDHIPQRDQQNFIRQLNMPGARASEVITIAETMIESMVNRRGLSMPIETNRGITASQIIVDDIDTGPLMTPSQIDDVTQALVDLREDTSASFSAQLNNYAGFRDYANSLGVSDIGGMYHSIGEDPNVPPGQVYYVSPRQREAYERLSFGSGSGQYREEQYRHLWSPEELLTLIKQTHNELARSDAIISNPSTNAISFQCGFIGSKETVCFLDPNGDVRLLKQYKIEYTVAAELDKARTYWLLQACFSPTMGYKPPGADKLDLGTNAELLRYRVPLRDFHCEIDRGPQQALQSSGSYRDVVYCAIKIRGALPSNVVIANIVPELYAKLKARETTPETGRKVNFNFDKGRISQ